MTFFKILIITLALLLAKASAAPSVSPLRQKKSPVKIEARGLVALDNKFFEDGAPKYEVSCPLEHCITQNPSYKERYTKSKGSELSQKIKEKIKCSWFKDDEPFVEREGGNRLDKFYNGQLMVLYQTGQTDQGRYRCELDYSEVPPDPDLVERFEFCKSVEFEITMFGRYLPDIPAIITNPPMDKIVHKGESVTWFCNQTDVLSTPQTYWYKSCPSAVCLKKFDEALSKAKRDKEEHLTDNPLSYMKAFMIPGTVNQLSLTVENVTEDKTGYYGCATKNNPGVDIRAARLQLYEQLIQNLDPKTLPSTHRVSRDSIDWIWLAIGMAAFCIPSILIASCVYFFRRSVLREKKQNAPLIQNNAGKDADSNDWNSRRRLPNIEAPDIYNTGKSHQGFITGHFHQPSGHMMTQSVCSKLLDKTTPSISSANSQQSDEASHQWGKSPYTPSSSTTATNVQMYDHPPSTGTLFFHGACINNPTYGLFRPDNEVYMLARQLEQLVISENDYTELDPEHAYYNVNPVEV